MVDYVHPKRRVYVRAEEQPNSFSIRFSILVAQMDSAVKGVARRRAGEISQTVGTVPSSPLKALRLGLDALILVWSETGKVERNGLTRRKRKNE